MKWLDLGWPLLLWLALAAYGAAVCGPLWWVIARQGRRLLPAWRRWRVSWNGFDAAVMFLLFLFIPNCVNQAFVLLKGRGEAAEASEIDKLWAQLLAVPFQVGLIVPALWLGRSARPAQLGLTGRRWPRNVVLGYLV